MLPIPDIPRSTVNEIIFSFSIRKVEPADGGILFLEVVLKSCLIFFYPGHRAGAHPRADARPGKSKWHGLVSGDGRISHTWEHSCSFEKTAATRPHIFTEQGASPVVFPSKTKRIRVVAVLEPGDRD